MPDAVRLGRTSVPDFGSVVQRARLLALFDRTRPMVTVVAAPAAYGKSVLASQIASKYGDAAVWLHLPAGCAGATEILSHAISTLSDAQPRGPAADFVPVSPPPAVPDLMRRLETLILERHSDGACVVLDNLCSKAGEAVGELAASVLQRGSGIRYVFTLRSTTDLPGCPLGAWQVSPRELLLDEDETREVVRQALGEDPPPDVVDHLARCSGRQPGLLSLMSRCVASEPGHWDSVVLSRHDLWDVLWRLAASQLSDSEQHLLRCMALLGAGTLSELSRVLKNGVTTTVISPIGAAIPLVSFEGRGAGCRFRLHELAQTVFGDPSEFSRQHADVFEEILSVLATRGDEERVVALAAASDDPAILTAWLEGVGFRVLRRGGIGVLGEALSGVSAVQLVDHPRLLVLKAAHELESGSVEAAYRDSRVARELAELESDSATLANAMLVLAQSTAGLCDFVLARTYFDRAIVLCGSSVDSETLTHLYGCRLAMDALFGDAARCGQARDSLVRLGRQRGDSADIADPLARFFVATGDIVLRGSWASSARSLESCSRAEGLGLSVRVAAAYNFFGCMLELGRIDEAEAALSKYDDLTDGTGNEGWEAAPISLRAGLKCARGTADGVCEQVRESAEREWERGERLSATTELTMCSGGLLGNRRAAEGLSLAETASRWADEVAGPLLVWSARLEEAACRLALGSEAFAAQVASQTARELQTVPAHHLRLRADQILAEIDLRRGDVASAVARYCAHVDYILTESANWQLAMSVRAFPRLLGPLTAATGATSLPVHMLQLILPEYAEDAVAAAKSVLSTGEFDILSQRLLGRKAVGRRSTDGDSEDVCAVRLFGGLHVDVAGRVVRDGEWRKRKARLLFAMLVSRCGKDVPRDQLTEYLWPEMEASQALNNLYVVWSAMKQALVPGSGRGDKCSYVEHCGGVCRAVHGRVLTDLDEFDDQLTIATKARTVGDGAAELAALRRVAEVYRGELLPGEAYDDWFAALRERCRHDFEDAMLRAANLLEAQGDQQSGLALLRRALQHDPWREDLYQAALRLQMGAGQRSAAIETYMTCRSRLVDDLGIDPSAATRRLYEQVLGMEEGPSDDARYSATDG